MTVKLAKLFSSTSSSMMSNNSSNLPPPLPPPNPPPKNYNITNQQNSVYHHSHHNLQLKSQKPYNPYMLDHNVVHNGDDDDGGDVDEDDNMSLYSTTASIMTSRDHPYNNSQRPLLAERKPQLLLQQQQQQQQNTNNKKKQKQAKQTANHQHYNAATTAPATATATHQKHLQKSYISPYVQQQKRDSAKGLHGFNDFDILSQQYNQHLQSPHIGYPYGSPPSPTANKIINNGIPQPQSHFMFDPIIPNSNSSSSIINKQNNPASISTALTSTPRYGNVHNYGSTSSSASSSTATSCHQRQQHYDINEADYCKSAAAATTQHDATSATVDLPKFSRFEDDFCSRRNIDFSKNSSTNDSGQFGYKSSSNHHQQQQLHTPVSGDAGLGGPFIFGISPEHQQLDYTVRMPSGGHSFGDISEDSGITKDGLSIDVDKYSTKPMQQSTSDTSSNSNDQSNCAGGVARKGAAKFLLRKRKSKKATKDSNICNEKSQDKPCVKCVVVGDCAVGKTNLILSYLENRFNTEHIPTASDIYNADVMVNDSPVHLTLCDTAGQDTLDPLRELCYPDSDVFLLCFSVAKPETFHAIKTKWAPRFAKTKASLILVGTQSDLRSNTNVLNKLQSNGEQPISYADAWDLATTIGAKYIETSSATQDKVKEVFDTAIWEGLAPTTLPAIPKIPLWKKLFCLA